MKKKVLFFVVIIMTFSLLAQKRQFNTIIQNCHKATVLVKYDQDTKKIFKNIFGKDLNNWRLYDWKVVVQDASADRECNVIMKIDKKFIEIYSGPKMYIDRCYKFPINTSPEILMTGWHSILYSIEHHYDKQ